MNEIIARSVFKRFFSFACAALLLALPLQAMPQTWPGKPLRIIVPVPPGADNDLIARLVGGKLSAALGQPVLVENLAGAGGVIAARQVARAAPDGYTLLFTSTSHVTALFLKKDLGYDPVRDFTPISAAAQIIGCIAVNPSVPANNIKELIDYSMRNPGKVAYGSPGVGTTFHLIGQLFNQATGASLVHVPYRGMAPAIADLAGGQIPVAFSSVSAIPKGQTDKVRVVAVLEPTRYAGLPDVPSVSETVASFKKPVSWFGLLGPANLPAPIVARLSAETTKALRAPDVKAKLDAVALVPLSGSPEELSDLLRSGIEDYGRIVKLVGIRPE